MAVFNLFPLPPLDGGRILVGLLPWRQAVMLSRVEPYGFFIVLALLVAGIITEWWMRPLMAVSEMIIDMLLLPLRLLLGI
jgi:Zn-dependent protease